MTTIESTSQVIGQPEAPFTLDEDQLAAVAFLARYRGRTLEAYRHDLRALFQWAAEHDLAVLEATRTHLELYRTSLEERGLAASTIDRRLSTACGFYRFAHIDGRIASNPAQYVRRPPSALPSGAVSTGASWPASSSPRNAATTPALP
jgi:integrase/recombinase XerD